MSTSLPMQLRTAPVHVAAPGRSARARPKHRAAGTRAGPAWTLANRLGRAFARAATALDLWAGLHAGANARLRGGNGDSADRPIVVHAASGLAGAAEQYRLLSSRFGEMDYDWTVLRRVHQTNARGRIIEKFVVARPKASNEVVYFDITRYYGRL